MGFMEKAFELAVVFSAVDHMTGPVNSMAKELGVLDEKTKETQKRLNEFKNMTFVGGAITMAGLEGAKAMEKFAEKAGEVQQQLIQMGGVYGLNLDSSSLKVIEDQAQELSNKTLFSKKELLGVDVELAHAGITQENLKQVMPESTYLAEVEVGMGKSQSAQHSAYNFARMAEDAGITNSAERMKTFADDINRIINVTHASSQSIAESFKYGMPVAKNLGWTEKDVLLATGLGARAGMEGSMAGTHIKNFIERINPYKYLGTTGGQKQLNAMNEMGLLNGVQTETDKKGNVKIVGFESADLIKDKDHLKSYAEMIDVLSKKREEFLAKGGNSKVLEGMSEEEIKKIQEQAKLSTGKELSGGELQWAAAANHLWGEQGQDFAILSSDKEMFTKLKKNMEIQKSLHEQIEVIRNSYSGQMHVLKSNFETLGLQIGKPIMEMLIPVIRTLGEWLGKLIQYFNDHPKIAKFAATIGAIATAAALVIGPMMTLVGVLGFLKTSKSLSAGFKLFSMALKGTAGPMLFLVSAGYLLYKAWTTNFGGIQEKSKAVFDWVKKEIPTVQKALHSVAKALGFETAQGFKIPGWVTTLMGLFVGGKTINFALGGLSKLSKLSKLGKLFKTFKLATGLNQALGLSKLASLKDVFKSIKLGKLFASKGGKLGSGMLEKMFGKRTLNLAKLITTKGFNLSKLFGKKAFDFSKLLGKKSFNLSKLLGKKTLDFSKLFGKKAIDLTKLISVKSFNISKLVGKKAFDLSKLFGKKTLDLSKFIGKGSIKAVKSLVTAVKGFGPPALNAVKHAGKFGLELVKLAGSAMASAIKMAAAWFIGLGPIGWIIAGVIAVLGLLWLAWKNNWGHIREHFAECVAWIKNKFNEFVTWIKDLPHQAAEWGKNLIQGFVNGIKSLGSWMKDEVTGFFNNGIVKNVKGLLGIHSPSVVMSEFGQYTVEGFANGMHKNMGMVSDASSKLTDLAKPSDVNSGFNVGKHSKGGNSGSDSQVIIEAGAIVINASPNQSAKEIAEEVLREIGRKMRNKNLTRSTAVTSIW